MTAILVRLCGLVPALLFWAVNMQVGQILPYSDCRTGVPWTAAVSILLTLLALAAALLPLTEKLPAASHTPSFVNRLSLLVGLVIAFAMLLQSAATLLVDTCQR